MSVNKLAFGNTEHVLDAATLAIVEIIGTGFSCGQVMAMPNAEVKVSNYLVEHLAPAIFPVEIGGGDEQGSAPIHMSRGWAERKLLKIADVNCEDTANGNMRWSATLVMAYVSKDGLTKGGVPVS